jgi:hypothetical protein
MNHAAPVPQKEHLMIMTGLFRFAVHPGVDAAAFEQHMAELFTEADALQLTRITTGFDHKLLAVTYRTPGSPEPITPVPGRQYIWKVEVNLHTDSGYDFHANAERVQERVADFATLIALEAYTNVESAT